MAASLFGHVPADTSFAFHHTHHPDPRCLLVGDQIGSILNERDLAKVHFAPHKPVDFVVVLALATLFQYLEHCTDEQAAEAIRSRVDWKYALHLPLSGSIAAQWLCRFRAYAFGSVTGMALLQALVERLEPCGLLDSARPAQAPDILQSICQHNRITWLTEGLLLAVEAIAARTPECLRALPLARLYESAAKSARAAREVKEPAEVTRLACQVEADIALLFVSLRACDASVSLEFPEIDTVRQVWEKQFIRPGPTWRPVDCIHCDPIYSFPMDGFTDAR